MPVKLKKNEQTLMIANERVIERVLIGLGWDAKEGCELCDLDTSVFLLNKSGQVREEGDFIYYHHLEHKSGAVRHCGDNRTGYGDGDDEQIYIDLNKVPRDVESVVFVVTLYSDTKQFIHFGYVKNAYIHVLNESSKAEIIRYDLTEDFTLEKAIIVAQFYRVNQGWGFRALGQGVSGGLSDLCKAYGVVVEDE
jgi:tellurium resistance protein TerD